MADKAFGTFEGKRVDHFTLTSETGVELDFITFGAAIRDWRVPVKGGLRTVVLGFDTLQPYVDYTQHFGALAGRVANRIAKASFEIEGKRYDLPANWKSHTLHGGPGGLGRLVWEAERDTTGNRIRFRHVSPDGDMGFPGRVEFTATYTLTGNRVRLDLAATTDAVTPISVVQHHYFNLGSTDTVLDHSYHATGVQYTEVDAELIPTGRLLPVDGTQWDLRQSRTMRDASGAPVDYDGNVVLDPQRDPTNPAAVVTGEDGALTLRLWTDRPGLQVYNSVMTPDGLIGLNGKRYGKYTGFCLEDQDFPDAVHHENFPSIWYGPGRDYSHWCEIEIA